MPYKDLTPPQGDKITRTQTLNVPDRPVIPFIRGDGTGPDIWAASERVLDAAVEKAYGGKKKIVWFEVFAGQSAKDKFDEWLPQDTVEPILRWADALPYPWCPRERLGEGAPEIAAIERIRAALA